MTENNTRTLEQRLKEVADHYITAKKHLLFFENYSNVILLGVLNEFRNAFDHLMKAFINDDDDEFDKAIKHLRRAAYDSCESTSIDSIKEIHRKICKYDLSVVTAVLPNYYSETYPRLLDIQEKISIERGKSDEHFKNENHLDEYTNLINELIEIDKMISKALKGMEEYDRQSLKSSRRERIRNIIINIVVGVTAAIVVFFLTKNL